jgi:Tfp pilus assembly protein PilF
MHVTFAPLLLALSLSLTIACPAAAQPVDQLPMYGGLDRNSDPSLRAADEKLVADTIQHYGSREKASAAFVGNGFAFYGRDDLANAMRRFNQAWLLDPNNPEIYFGFAVVLHDKGKNCEAVTQFEKAASFGRYVQGMAPDAARVIVLCAIADKALSEEARSALFARSDALYAEALNSEPNKGYVHASMASALYWRGKYAEAWAAVKLARANGGRLPEQFLRLLQEKMPEPA